jgi:hypothetical protein
VIPHLIPPLSAEKVASVSDQNGPRFVGIFEFEELSGDFVVKIMSR